MLRMVILALSLFITTARADIEITNNVADLANSLDVVVNRELVGQRIVSISQTVTVPARTLPFKFAVIRLCHSDNEVDNLIRIATAPTLEVKFTGEATQCAVSRVISVWPTQYDAINPSTVMQTGKQSGNRLDFAHGMNFHDNWSVAPPKTTGGQYQYRGLYGAGPPGYMSAVFIRAEGARNTGDSAGLGLAQCNIASSNVAVEGSTSLPPTVYAMRNMAKHLARVNQTDFGEILRVPVLSGNYDSTVMVHVADHSRCLYYAHGYELRTQPTVTQ